MRKTHIFRLSAVLLAAVLLLTASGCSKKNWALKAGKVTMPEQIFAYYMSCYRPYWAYTFSQEDNEEFWASSLDGVTVADYLQDVTLTAIKSKVAAAYLFDEYKLTLSDAKKAEVDAILSDLLLGVGGEEEFEKDELMQQLNMTTDDMRDIFLLNAKADALSDYLYGEQGREVVTTAEREEYYTSNYYRYQHLYLMDVDFVRDEDGKIQYDSDGYAKWEEISDARWDEKFTLGQSLLERAQAGEDFQTLIKAYSEELSSVDYKYGHYVNIQTTNENNYFPEIVTGLKTLDIGECMLFRSSYGLHLIKRLQLDEGGYTHEENEVDFYDFEELVVEEKYKTKLQGCFDEIQLNEQIVSSYRINEVPYSESWTYMF